MSVTRIPASWNDLVANAHGRAFTTATSVPEHWVQAMSDQIDRLVAAGASLNKARTALRPLVSQILETQP